MARYREGAGEHSDRSLRRLRALARLLDSSIPLPGGYRIGLDGLIGLLPGIGDALGASLSAYIVLRAAQLGAPWTTLLRMAANVLVDGMIGLIPVLGDLFDFAWKANLRNMQLLESAMERPPARGTAEQRLRMVGYVLVAAIAAFVLLSLYLFIKLLLALFGGG